MAKFGSPPSYRRLQRTFPPKVPRVIKKTIRPGDVVETPKEPSGIEEALRAAAIMTETGISAHEHVAIGDMPHVEDEVVITEPVEELEVLTPQAYNPPLEASEPTEEVVVEVTVEEPPEILTDSNSDEKEAPKATSLAKFPRWSSQMKRVKLLKIAQRLQLDVSRDSTKAAIVKELRSARDDFNK